MSSARRCCVVSEYCERTDVELPGRLVVQCVECRTRDNVEQSHKLSRSI